MQRVGTYKSAEGCVYRKGCDVVLNSSLGSPEEARDSDNAWIGQVLAMRTRVLPIGVEGWAEVRWYYSPQDIEALRLEGLTADLFSARERVLSDVLDLVPLGSFISPVDIHIWNEEALEPPELDEHSYFHRCNVKDLFTPTPKWAPFPGQFSCICKEPYDPFPKNLDIAEVALGAFDDRNHGGAPNKIERTADYMHFCPRPKCGKWFHETCLLHHARTHPQQTDFVGSLAIRRLAVDPDKSCPHPRLARFAYTKPGWGKSLSADTLGIRAALMEALGPGAELALPDALLAVAALPIVRRAGRGAFSSAGNVRDVVLARRIVFQALEGGFADLERLVQSLPARWTDGPERDQVWRILGTQRMLACPRAVYWEERAQELANLAERPALHCPDCSGEVAVAI